MKIACLFGSFNPIHYGHIHLAEKVLKETNIDEVWFIISPQNPFKKSQKLVDENLRKEMVKLMIDDTNKMKVCDIEFTLPKPSYTYKTIESLKKKYPDNKFEIIIGSDALNTIERWRNYKDIVKQPIIGFIRNNEKINTNVKSLVKNLTIINSESNTSSTFIRNYINWNRIDDLVKLKILNKKTVQFIKNNKLYN